MKNINGNYECPTHKKQSTFKVCSNVDMWTFGKKLYYAETKQYSKLFPIGYFVRFDCGCFIKFKQIDFDEKGNCINIILK